MQPIPFAVGTYADDARPFTAQDCVGMLPVNAELPGTRSPALLRNVPGLRPFAYLTAQRQRGAREVEGKLFFVADTKLCQLHPSGGITILGTIPGTGRVSMSHNQIAGGNQVKIVNGSAGYIWNTVTGVLTRITDASYPGAILTEFISQLFVDVEPQRRYAIPSALADGLSYDQTETFQGESRPDRIVSAAVCNGEYVLLNESSIEHFDYTGVVNELFANKKIPLNRGCAATHAVSNLDSALFFIGEDGSGYAKRGYQLQRITTHAIEQAWARCDLAKAYSFVWEDAGHKVWYVTFPDGLTWGYDCATQRWHRRESKGLNHWRLGWLVKWRGEWVGGDRRSGAIFKLDWDYPLEGADELPRRWRGPKIHRNSQPFTLNRLKFSFDCAFHPNVEATEGADLQLSGDLEGGEVTDEVDYTYTVSGANGPFVLSVLGSLPDGLEMDEDGHVTGTFEAAGDFSWQIQAVDANGVIAILADSCTVTVLPLVITGTLPDGEVGTPYSETLTVSGGVPAYANCTISSGALPPGLSIALLDDIITVSGTPT